jgi:hypothetical protein
MALFQRNDLTIHKTKTGTVAGKFSYTYAPLEEFMNAVRGKLAENGLSVSWRTPRTEDTKVVRVCRVSHALGHFEESGEVVIPIGGADDRSGASAAQRVGIAITYAERYSLKDILGLSPEDDDDAQGPDRPKPEDAHGTVPPDDVRTITAPQAKRLWAIARQHGWSEEEMKDLLTAFGVDHTDQIPMAHYEAVIDKLKARAKK